MSHFLRPALVSLCALAYGTAAVALSAGDQYKLDQILTGGPESIRAAAKSIAGSGAAPQVLDALAEAAFTRRNEQTRTGVDAVAWSCKALAAAGGKRYYSVVRSIANSEGTHRSARKHCGRAAETLGGAEGKQYVAGSVSLDKARASRAASASQATAPARAAPANSGKYSPVTEIKVGMSEQEAYAIAGPPTSTTSHITGKSFIPYNFKGGDTRRTIALYKGQGRVVFSNNSRYSSGRSVIEVQINPGEGGYP